MKNAVVFSAVLFLMCFIAWTGGPALASEQGFSFLAQNQYGDEGREYEQGPHPDYEGPYSEEQPEELEPPSFPEGEEQELPEELEPPEYPEGEEQPDEEQPELPPLPGEERQDEQEQIEQPELPPLPEGEGEYDQEQQYPNEPEPYQEPEGLLDREQLEKDEPGSGDDLEENLQEDVPALGDTAPDAALSAGGSSALQAASGQCSKAAGKVIILLDAAGIHPGTTYIKSEGQVVFSNTAQVTHPVTVSPKGILSSDSFRITPGSKVLMFAGSTTQPRHGLVKVNAGKSNETAHDVIICP